MVEAGKSGKLKALYVVGSNPIGRLDIDPFAFSKSFVVVQDMFLTETAVMADVVLPAANAYEKSGSMTNTCGDVQLVKKAGEISGTKTDFEMIVRIADAMGSDVRKLVPFGGGTRADMGQSRGAQSGEADRHAVWLEMQGLEPKLSPLDPMAILDEIQRLVPGYDVSRMNLLAGNSEHTSLDKERAGRGAQGGIDFSGERWPVYVRHAGTLLAHVEVGDGESRSETCGSRGRLIRITAFGNRLSVREEARRAVANLGLHSRVGDQVSDCSGCAAHRGRLYRLAGAQSRGPHAESLGTHAGRPVWPAAAGGRRNQVSVQRRSDAAARLQAAVHCGAADRRHFRADFDRGDSVRQRDHDSSDTAFRCRFTDVNTGLLLILGVTSIGVYGVALAGWSSNNKYSLLGGLRASAQMVSYEISLGLSLVGVLIMSGSFSLRDDCGCAGRTFLGIHSALEYFHGQFIGFFCYLMAAYAETNRIPFDLPEAETELVAGYHTEYSAMKFAMFFMAEYANMITVACLATLLFFGGWHGPMFGPRRFCRRFCRCSGLWRRFLHFSFCTSGCAGTLPRFRYDQLMAFGWKFLLPLALANLIATAIAVAW